LKRVKQGDCWYKSEEKTEIGKVSRGIVAISTPKISKAEKKIAVYLQPVKNTSVAEFRGEKGRGGKIL